MYRFRFSALRSSASVSMNIRRRCLQCLLATGTDLAAEWGLCWAVGEANCKNYQLWHHRRRCALALGPDNAPRELEFAAHFLQQDAKNYHVWAHRQARLALPLSLARPALRAGGEGERSRAVLPGRLCAMQLCWWVPVDMLWLVMPCSWRAPSHHCIARALHSICTWAGTLVSGAVVQAVIAAFDCWEGEPDFVDGMLDEDPLNNSAWAQRAFLLSHRLQAHMAALRSSSAAGAAPAHHQSEAQAAQPRRAGGWLALDDNADFLQSMAAAEQGLRSGFADAQPPASEAAAHADAARGSGSAPAGTLQQCVDQEIAYTRARALRVPHNESVWNHLWGLQHTVLAALAQVHRGHGIASPRRGSAGGLPALAPVATKAASQRAAADDDELPEANTPVPAGTDVARVAAAAAAADGGGSAFGRVDSAELPESNTPVPPGTDVARVAAAAAAAGGDSPSSADGAPAAVPQHLPDAVAQAFSGVDLSARDAPDACAAEQMSAVQQRASECLAHCSAPLRQAAQAAYQAALQAVFDVACEALERDAGCIQAQSALLRAYAVVAAMRRSTEEVSAAQEAAMALGERLREADPIHAGWYDAVCKGVGEIPC